MSTVTEVNPRLKALTEAGVSVWLDQIRLHSTGQLHKGAPPIGRFLQLIADPRRDADIPGAPYSFGTLIAAQAAGDLQTLRGPRLKAERVNLEGDPVAAVRALTERLTGLLNGK